MRSRHIGRIRLIVAALSAIVLATPVGAKEALEFTGDRVDVPFVRDCHGLHPHHSECGR